MTQTAKTTMAQTNKTCKICKEVGHSQFYCKQKPRKPIQSKSVRKPLVKRPIKKKTRGQLVKELDAVFSRYIRLRDADEFGEATCVTCGETKPWKELQNGHFFSRGRYSTRWDEDNCHVQCVKCNVMLNGNYIQYTKFMLDTYGRAFVDALETRSQTTLKLPTPTIREMTAGYKKKVEAYDRA